MLKVGWELCPFCYRQEIYNSSPKHLWEKAAILVLLQPVRCHDCMRRFLRPLFASPAPKIPVGRAASKETTHKTQSAIDRGRAA